MRNREIREARINDAATKIRVFFLSFLLETVFVEPARTRYTKVSTVSSCNRLIAIVGCVGPSGFHVGDAESRCISQTRSHDLHVWRRTGGHQHAAHVPISGHRSEHLCGIVALGRVAIN